MMKFPSLVIVPLTLVFLVTIWIQSGESQLLPLPPVPDLPTGYFLLRNKQSSYCAAVDYSGPLFNGLPIVQIDCLPLDYTQWTLVPSTKSLNYYQLKLKQSGKCIVVNDLDGTNANETPVIHTDCNVEDPKTLWTFKAQLGLDYLQVIGLDSGKCLTLKNGWTWRGVALVISDCSSTSMPIQGWTPQPTTGIPGSII